jgi:hypothetical protein
MTKVRISGIPGFEGEYKVATPPFSTREWREIKQHTGLLPADLDDHMSRRDPDVSASVLWVTLTRAGKDPRETWAALDESDMFSDDTFDVTAEAPAEDDAVPPESTPASTDDGNETKPADDTEPSAETSPAPTVRLESVPSPTGTPLSATGSD